MEMKITRRSFVSTIGIGVPMTLLSAPAAKAVAGQQHADFLRQWANPPREFSQAPFWFWNDDLSEAEIVRQMDDFCAHGVYGFVIHPRAGLPRSIGWMSERMIHFMRFAIEQAVKKDMWVVLYDEGMYPSGSSSGQVVAENPAYRTRGLFAIDLDNCKPGDKKRGFRIGDDGKPILSEDQYLVAVVPRKKNGHRIALVDRAIRPGYSLIRGLHFLEEDPPRRPNKKEVPENMPPLADILNPEAVACFIRLVYQRFYDEFGDYFGKTIKGIFTDEPSFLGKRGEPGAVPGTRGILDHVNLWLGYDFTPHLPALWYKDEPEAEKHKDDYDRALQARLEETYYRQISHWCENHRTALAGHPADPDDIGHLRHFHMPGQDIVWRYIEPGKPSALEGSQSTQAKCASSAMIHLGRRRNSNEYCGAYGHNFTFREMKWLANWLIVRGCNLLYPHAFYYSVRGPRIDERPPDVGPNNTWWDEFKPFADATSRLCWLNTDSTHVCGLAILGLNDYLPWQAAKVCFQHQRDFNYLEARHVWEDAEVTEQGIRIAGMHYKALIVEFDPPAQAQPSLEILERAGRLIRWRDGESEEWLVKKIDRLVSPDIQVSPHTLDLRVRHVVKHGVHGYMLFNEGERNITADIALSTPGTRHLLDAENGEIQTMDGSAPLNMPAHTMQVVMIPDSSQVGSS
jgi:hypothetical protein